MFLTVRGTQQGDFAMVCYDPDIKKGTKLKDLKAKYIDGFPYMERFAPVKSTSEKVWEGKDRVCYGKQFLGFVANLPVLTVYLGGVFGGPDPKDQKYLKRSPLSDPWPFTDAGNPIHHGVYISYWWYPNVENGRGMHTSSIHKPFQKGSEVPYMYLYKGNPNSLISAKSKLFENKATSITIDYYSTFEGDLDWEKEAL